MSDVDGVLTQLQGLLGKGQLPSWPTKTFGSPVSPVSSWQGDASIQAHVASDALNGRRTTLAQTYASVAPLVASAGHISTSSRDRIEAIRAQWRADQAAFAPIADTPAGHQALLQLGALRINEGTQVVQQANTQFKALAGQVGALATRLPATTAPGTTTRPANGSVNPVDFKQGPPSDPNDPYYNHPPEPGGGYGSYHYGYDFQTPEGWTQEQIMGEVQKNFNKYFTFTADKPSLVNGAVINLKGPLGEDEPVKVTSITPNSFSFVSLPGHGEGAGRVIRFSVVPAQASPIPGKQTWQLQVAASGPLSWGSLVPGASWGNKLIWQQFADNLNSRLPSLPPQSGLASF